MAADDATHRRRASDDPPRDGAYGYRTVRLLYRGPELSHPRWQFWLVALSAGLALGACASTPRPQPTSTQRPQPTSTPRPEAPIPISPSLDSSANLLNNGSFEQPTLNNADPPNPPFVPLPGWAMTGYAELLRGALYGNPYIIPLDGSQYLVLTGTVRTRGQISQRVHTVPGDTYRLTFLEGTSPDCSGGDNELDVYWNGVQVLGISSTPVRPTKSRPKSSVEGWYTDSDASLVATTSITTMSFAGGVGCGAAFDNVVLQEAPPTR